MTDKTIDKSDSNIRQNSFLSGVFLLSFSTVIVKIIGLACKIPLISVLGAEGMGYFNSAYEIYALLCVISTAGLPVALSILISAAYERKDGKSVKSIWHSALFIFVLLGVFGTAILLFFASPIAQAVGNDAAASALAAIAPALFFVCFSSAVRGYFQGFGYMVPTAVSQLIEAIGKLIFGVLFAIIALNRGTSLPVASAYAVFGITLGTALSSLYLLILKSKDKRTLQLSFAQKAQNERIMRTLIGIAFPITLSSAVLSITRMIDMSLILRRLGDIGISSAQANEIYGSYTTLAIPVFSLVPSLITPISLSLVPQLSTAIEKGSELLQNKIFSESMRLTVLFALPASMGIALYARPILSILFTGQSEAIDISAPLLSVLGTSVLFSCLITTTNAILQSYRKTFLPIISMLAGAITKTVGAYFMIGNSRIGVMGAPLSTFFCNFVIICLNLYYVSGVIRDVIAPIKDFARAFVASVASIGLSFAIYLPILCLTDNEAVAFLCAAAVAVLSYLAFAILTRAVTKNDLELISCLKNRKKKKINQ